MDFQTVTAAASEAEAGLIGSILFSAQALDAAVDAGVEGRMFSNPLFGAAFGCALRMVGEGKALDAHALHVELKRDGVEHAFQALHGTTELVSTGRGAATLAARVVEGFARREIVRLTEQAQAIAKQEAGTPTELLERIQQSFAGLSMARKSRVPRKLGEVVIERIERLQHAAEGKAEPVGWPLGIPQLDTWLGGGLRPGNLYVLAARPSVGKSSFAESLALHVAKSGHPTLFLSQEMPNDEVGDRAIANLARVRYDLITQAKMLTDGDWGQMADAAEVLHGAPIWVDDEPALSLPAIRRKALFRPGLKILVLDYLQLCQTPGKQNRTAEIGEISRGLKALAKELGLAVIALSQLNREVEKRVNGRPVMSDLRDSGEIEQDADVILFLWRLGKPVPGEVTRIGCGVEKNRQGMAGGALTLGFKGETQSWAELSNRIDEAEMEMAPRRGKSRMS